MINSNAFADRLHLIMDYYALSASVFADRIGVQRSGISHILSGRNKPSLDFILKIVEEFKEVNLYWLLYGQGSFPPSEDLLPENTITQETATKVSIQKKISPSKNIEKENVRIAKIIVLYENGSFDSFEN